MPTITDLPDELLDEIAQLLPKGTLFSLCTVSNRFQPRATRWLYRSLALAGNGETIKICKVLVSNKLAAISVRKVLLWPGLAFSRLSLTGGYVLAPRYLHTCNHARSTDPFISIYPHFTSFCPVPCLVQQMWKIFG